jgi:hypothetical protein
VIGACVLAAMILITVISRAIDRGEQREGLQK